jgi:hypothetical protein
MKKDTITIARAEYAHLNKAANAAVEHALELVQASRLVDDLKARIAELEAERDDLQARIERVRLYGKNIAYTAKYRRNDWAMGEESATNFILSILDGTHKD